MDTLQRIKDYLAQQRAEQQLDMQAMSDNGKQLMDRAKMSDDSLSGPRLPDSTPESERASNMAMNLAMGSVNNTGKVAKAILPEAKAAASKATKSLESLIKENTHKAEEVVPKAAETAYDAFSKLKATLSKTEPLVQAAPVEGISKMAPSTAPVLARKQLLEEAVPGSVDYLRKQQQLSRQVSMEERATKYKNQRSRRGNP